MTPEEIEDDLRKDNDNEAAFERSCNDDSSKAERDEQHFNIQKLK